MDLLIKHVESVYVETGVTKLSYSFAIYILGLLFWGDIYPNDDDMINHWRSTELDIPNIFIMKIVLDKNEIKCAT